MNEICNFKKNIVLLKFFVTVSSTSLATSAHEHTLTAYTYNRRLV